MARKVYLNSRIGFDLVSGAEREMAKCFATLPFNGTINVQSSSLGFVKLPPAFGTTFEKPLCEDYDNHSFCGGPDNTDACLGNDTFDFAVFPTSFCDNGLRDGDETVPDVCPAARPTCNSLSHHCQ